jgi:hypothetical protein
MIAMNDVPSRGMLLALLGQAFVDASDVLCSERPTEGEGAVRYQGAEQHVQNLVTNLKESMSPEDGARPAFQRHHERATYLSAHAVLTAVALMLAYDRRQDGMEPDCDQLPGEADVVWAWEQAGLPVAQVADLLLAIRRQDVWAAWAAPGTLRLHGRNQWQGSVRDWLQQEQPHGDFDEG